MSRLIIADIHSNNNGGNCTGHYIAVARMYRELFRKITKVKIASGPIYKKYFDESDMIMLPYDMVAGENYVINRIKALWNAKRLFAQTRNDIIVLQDGKPLTNHIGALLFCHRKQRLYLIKYTTAGLSSVMGKFVWSLLRRKVKGIICPNEEVGQAFDVPYSVVPDYIYSGESSRCKVGYDEKEYDFCIVGRLNKDKGVDRSLLCLAGSHYKVLVAGMPENKQYGDLLRSICSMNPNIDLRLGYVDEKNYQHYIDISRYCLLNYQGEYSKRSSGVVYDIVFSGVPVVGNRCKALQFVEDSGVGCIVDSLNSIESEDLFHKEKYELFLDNIDRYKEYNSKAFDVLRRFFEFGI